MCSVQIPYNTDVFFTILLHHKIYQEDKYLLAFVISEKKGHLRPLFAMSRMG